MDSQDVTAKLVNYFRLLFFKSTFFLPEIYSQPCRNGGTCIEGYGEWSCECPPMVHGRNNCSETLGRTNANHCEAGGTCKDKGLDFECLCPPGRKGKTCEQGMPTVICISKPCKNGGQCVNGDNEYTCNCLMGFTGINCDIGKWQSLFTKPPNNVDECAHTDCGPHGTCVNLPGGFACDCEYGYEGEMCDKGESTLQYTFRDYRTIYIFK
ncbi:EGF and EGF CA domain containing protein [Trichuris trichiura]|uniref:EGF and EGF CA domain containing protein n=1 Tax=Trichuris trichiura TaxID=36087 RepID=A0A077ZMC8_TRITR|nr:EGF and EGF CA domain containing protein [Trichuris trichiura]